MSPHEAIDRDFDAHLERIRDFLRILPSGCRLHPRCPHRFEPCDSEDPPLFEAGEGEHRAACLLLRDGNVNGSG